MENHHRAIFMGKSTISTGPCSIAMLFVCSPEGITDPFWNITCSILPGVSPSCLIIDVACFRCEAQPKGPPLLGWRAGWAGSQCLMVSCIPASQLGNHGEWDLTSFNTITWEKNMGYVCSPVLTIHCIPSPSSAPNPCVQSLAYIHRVSCVTHGGKIDVLQISKNQLLATVNNVFC